MSIATGAATEAAISEQAGAAKTRRPPATRVVVAKADGPITPEAR